MKIFILSISSLFCFIYGNSVQAQNRFRIIPLVEVNYGKTKFDDSLTNYWERKSGSLSILHGLHPPSRNQLNINYGLMLMYRLLNGYNMSLLGIKRTYSQGSSYDVLPILINGHPDPGLYKTLYQNNSLDLGISLGKRILNSTNQNLGIGITGIANIYISSNYTFKYLQNSDQIFQPQRITNNFLRKAENPIIEGLKSKFFRLGVSFYINHEYHLLKDRLVLNTSIGHTRLGSLIAKDAITETFLPDGKITSFYISLGLGFCF